MRSLLELLAGSLAGTSPAPPTVKTPRDRRPALLALAVVLSLGAVGCSGSTWRAIARPLIPDGPKEWNSDVAGASEKIVKAVKKAAALRVAGSITKGELEMVRRHAHEDLEAVAAAIQEESKYRDLRQAWIRGKASGAEVDEPSQKPAEDAVKLALDLQKELSEMVDDWAKRAPPQRLPPPPDAEVPPLPRLPEPEGGNP